MIINHNLSALTAFNQMGKTENIMKSAAHAIATGKRINSAADDASGLAISERMRSQILGLDKAIQNTQDGISLLQTAEGALNNTTSILQRMRELSVQAANDTLTSIDRNYVQQEMNQLREQINEISNTTQFNRRKLLNGEAGALWSSSDSGLKAIINGSLSSRENSDKTIEGNYKIEIRANPGKAQVQKSNIIDVDYVNETAEVTAVETYHTETYKYEININDGVNTRGESSGVGWNFSGGVLTFTENGTYSVFGNVDSAGNTIVTHNYIKVNPGVTANIFLRDVHVEASNFAFEMTGATVNLYLDPGSYDNENIFDAGFNTVYGHHCSAIEAPAGSTLTITSKNGDYNTSGKLNVTGGVHGAGIGGSCRGISSSAHTSTAGNITIYGGTITAQGGPCAAGIGGGWAAGSSSYGQGGNIAIYGGIIKATGGEGGAGIGAGGFNDSTSGHTNTGTITIGPDTVLEAYGGSSANYPSSTYGYGPYSYNYVGEGAGIGGGGGWSSGTVIIDSSLQDNIPNNGNKYNSDDSIGPGQHSTSSNVNYTSVSTPPAREVPELPEFEEQVVEISYVENGGVEPHTLKTIKQFYNSDGTFLIEDPQKITITQGDGKTTSVMLYSGDTLEEVAERINDAIATGLGQGKYVDNGKKFCTLARGINNTSESVASLEGAYQDGYEKDADGVYELDEDGNLIPLEEPEFVGEMLAKSTFVVRSVVPGKEGELYFSGDQEILKVLGFNTIQESSESTYSASIYDAHSGEVIADNVKVTGNIIREAITSKVDIEFDSMAGIAAQWDNKSRSYKNLSTGSYSGTLHLADNTIYFQTGANEREDFAIDLGDMSAGALGLDGVNLATRETASRSITMIDNAIDKVSSQRAKIGAYINTLESTLEVLSTESTNLSRARSQITDADIARETLKFVKMQVMNQSAAAVLAQANMLSSSVVNLLN